MLSPFIQKETYFSSVEHKYKKEMYFSSVEHKDMFSSAIHFPKAKRLTDDYYILALVARGFSQELRTQVRRKY